MKRTCLHTITNTHELKIGGSQNESCEFHPAIRKTNYFRMKITFFKITTLAIIMSLHFTSHSESLIKKADSFRIKQKSVLKLIEKLNEKGISDFSELTPSVDENTDTNGFDSNTHIFHNSNQIEDVWTDYLKQHPSKIWNGKTVSMGFIYSPDQKINIFQDDVYPGIKIGQVYFIEMKVLLGIVKFPVCFMITRVDNQKHEIEFSYIDQGVSKGRQTIKLIDEGTRGTRIIHSSIHLTENALRDKTMYPIYHKKAISEVHRNIEKNRGAF